MVAKKDPHPMKFLYSLGELLLKILLISFLITFFSFLGMLMMDFWVELSQERQIIDVFQEAWRQSVDYLKILSQGNLGTVMMVSGETEVIEILIPTYKNSMGLVGIALGLALLLGTLMGSIAALTKHRGQAFFVLFGAIIGISMPSFLLAVLLQSLGIKYTITFGSRLVSMGGLAWDFKHLAMPVLVLMARPLAYITRATYISLVEIRSADYIRTAYSKGLRDSHVFGGHILRNLGIPLLTAFVVSFRFVLGVLPIVEFIFGWNGVGLNALDAVQRREPVLFIALVLALSLTIQLLNAFVDWLNHLIDPRLGRG